MTRFRAVVLTVALLAAACGGDEDPFAPLPDVEDGEEQTTTSETTTTTSPSATTATSDDEPADVSDSDAAVLETWTTLLEAAASGSPSPEQLDVIASLSSDNTTTQLEDFFPEAPARQLTHYPALTANDDGTVAIDDCIIMNQGISPGFSNWFVGQATPEPESPTGWHITSVQLINLDNCVPTSIAEAAIQGYENYVEARGIYFNPPDPESPLIEQTATGEHKQFVIGLVEDLQRNNQILVTRPEPDPGFAAILSATEVVITDCQLTGDDYGVYDAANGERTDRIAPVSPGELDLVETTMTFEGGQWKTSKSVAEGNVQCRTPPVPQKLQISGL